ncbi:MAG: 2-amino-4-hydroxy-6-hydroxymethyldihydropteridine diphosphokinase [Firmicutes bacterium]|nr:2-amino-4-hydroxy-6-hydroxymethyldihydropteridine diphosphokinase [Bacillota bacterium]
MDRINIYNLEIFAYHGVLAEEKAEGQFFYVDAELELDLSKAGKSDDLMQTVNYAEVCESIRRVMTENVFDLIETCAEQIAQTILLENPLISTVTVSINKPHAPIPMEFENVAVTVTRCWHKAYIALGSNIGDSEVLISEAVAKLDGNSPVSANSNTNLTRVTKQSTLIKTKPYGVLDQPDFVNGMLEIETLLSPHELLDRLHEIEAEAGRERKLRWGPRTLDLDIILYDDEIIEDDDLCVPHVDMANRDFVLKPLAEIAPYKVHPVECKRIIHMLRELEERDGATASDGGAAVDGSNP